MDGSSVIRIKPMTEEQREMSERLVLGLGYQGQNLLCSNWNTESTVLFLAVVQIYCIAIGVQFWHKLV